MSDLLVRNVPEDVLDRLRRRAAENGRSLQQEILEILEQEVLTISREEMVRTNREEMLREMEQFREEVRKTGRPQSDSADLIRKDRER